MPLKRISGIRPLFSLFYVYTKFYLTVCVLWMLLRAEVVVFYDYDYSDVHKNNTGTYNINNSYGNYGNNVVVMMVIMKIIVINAI